jgi:hypoxanthine-guanine phosphoribosyltransferase
MAEEGKTISGDDLYEIIQEAKAKNVTVASLMHKLPNTQTRVFVTPGPGVVEQAPRSGRNKDA